MPITVPFFHKPRQFILNFKEVIPIELTSLDYINIVAVIKDKNCVLVRFIFNIEYKSQAF